MSALKLILKPTIRILSRQDDDLAELDLFLADRGASDWITDANTAAEKLSEIAGRECYNSFKNPRPGGNKSYLDRIISEGHGRVLEHAVWTLAISGVSRSFAQELYTHTIGLSKSMLSQRFVDESNCAFVVPPAIHPNAEPLTEEAQALAIFTLGCEDAARRYRALVEVLEGIYNDPSQATLHRKMVREGARSLLPNCVETRIILTGNARALRNLLEMRGSIGADAEIRRFALALLPIMQAEAPNIFGDYEVRTAEGIEFIHTDHRKV